jgi:hypothetical protein
MTKQERLEIKVGEFIARQKGAFCLDDLAEDTAIAKIGGKTPLVYEELFETLENNTLTFSTDGHTFMPL